MPEITRDQMTAPQYSSVLLVGPSKTGKTFSIGTLHRVLRMLKMPTKMMLFDFDEDGYLSLLRLAREGRESYKDKPGTVEPWTDDLRIFNYRKKEVKLREHDAAPARSQQLSEDFQGEFNQMDAWLDHKTGLWLPGKEIGAIIYDSLTSLMHMYESYVWSIRNKEIGLVGTGGISWQDWNLVGEKIRDAYQTAKQFPCFFVATAHEDTRQEQIKGSATPAQDGKPAQPPTPVPGAVFAVPLLTYSLSMYAAGDFGCVVHSTTNFKWVGRPGGRIRSAGSRLRDLPDGEFEQDFANLITID